MNVRISALLASLTLGLITLSGPALAGETTITGASGEEVTVERDLEKTETGVSGTRTVTGPEGQQNVSEFDLMRDDSGLNGTRTTTYSNGTSSSQSSTFTGDGEGNYSGTVNRTNRQGTTNTYGIEGQRSRENGTFNNNATITGPNDRQGTYSRVGTFNDGSYTSERTLTYPGGRTRNTSGTYDRVGAGEWSGTRNVTNRRGVQRSYGVRRNR